MAAFQSTCLREARRCLDTEIGQLYHFNPRAYVRHDLNRALIFGLLIEFQSTCLREARPARQGVTLVKW